MVSVQADCTIDDALNLIQDVETSEGSGEGPLGHLGLAAHAEGLNR
jgi:hypothetical protein